MTELRYLAPATLDEAIGALGLGTSVKTIIGLGWRHVTTVLGASAVILVLVTGGLLLMRVA